jgi:predicted nucleic acid-binding protein
MERLVVDASATLALAFEEGDVESLRIVFDSYALAAPWIWRLEVVNAVLVRERRKRGLAASSSQILSILEDFDVEIVGEPERRQLSAIADLARPHQLTAYDAAYLEVAMNMGLKLCTLDSNLRQAARAVGVELVGQFNSA